MLHELLTLEHYLAAKDTLTEAIAGVLRDEVPFAADARSPHQPIVPADLAHFVRHGFSKNPNERYRSVTEMLDRLQRIEDGHCPVECPATMMKRMGTETSHVIDRRPFVMLGAAVFTVIFALFGVGVLLAQMM